MPSTKGIRLTLLAGPAVPVPVPQEVIDALTSVQVTATAGKGSGFQLAFTLSQRSPLHTAFLLMAGGVTPMMRVILVVTLDGTPEVLMDGVMTNHEVAPGKEPGESRLTITGEDLSVLMDNADLSGTPFPAMPREERVLLILAKYAAFGLVPLVCPSILLDVPLPSSRIFRQQGRDLQYVRKLAAEVGYVFYVEPGPKPGTSHAYWGPEVKIGVPQPALNVNMDAHNNVEALTFNFDARRKRLPIVMIQNDSTKVTTAVPVPDLTPLSPPLGLFPPLPLRTKRISETAKLSPVRAATIGLAKAARWSDCVFGTGSLDVLRYGRILKAGRLVGVRGAGAAFDGLHYVTGVTHRIERGQYRQDFHLSRNALVSTLREVPA